MSAVVVDGDSEAVPVVPTFSMRCGCESAVEDAEEVEGELVALVSSRSPEPLLPINFAGLAVDLQSSGVTMGRSHSRTLPVTVVVGYLGMGLGLGRCLAAHRRKYPSPLPFPHHRLL